MKYFSSLRLGFAIIFPIIALLCLLLYKQNIINTGQNIRLDIVGFDPRDLLSGHYLRYQIDYHSRNPCQTSPKPSRQTVRLCLQPERYFIDDSSTQQQNTQQYCDVYLQGVCSKTTFIAGIERFYIPEKYAPQLDSLVRDARGALQISVNSRGKAVIETLLIDGEPWQDKVK
jgi:uncharacterized membrane-anchored protein